MDKTMAMALKRHREQKMNIDGLLADEDHEAKSPMIERHNEDRNLEHQESEDLAPTTRRIDGMHDYDKQVPGEEDRIPNREGVMGKDGIPEVDIKSLLGSEGGSGLRKFAVKEHDARDSKNSEKWGGEEEGDKNKNRPRLRGKALFQTNKYE